jgi:tRNA pseudouridine55 synthase
MDGFINLNKPKGLTSAKALAIVKGILKSKGVLTGKIGHLGTLDPDAEGVLPIAVGKATKLFEEFLTKQKVYYSIFCFGKTSDTLDASGTITETSPVIVKLDEVKKAVENYKGEISQIPPMYSAKSVNGVRAYELARKGIEVELKPKKVKIYSFEVLEELGNSRFSFRIICGGGTYIRSLARDLALDLGTVGLMEYLKREQSGDLKIENSFTLQDLREKEVKEFFVELK